MTSLPSRPAPDLLLASTAGAYAAALGDAVSLLTERVRLVDAARSPRSEAELRALVDAVDLDRPLGDTRAALAEVADLYLEHAVWFHDRGYLAHLNCPVAIPALAADVLASAVNTSMDTWDQSTTATLIEQRLIAWTARLIEFGDGADGVFTSGGTASNLQALLLAREHALSTPDPATGLPVARRDALPRLRVLASAATHFSIAKAARVLGLAPDAVVTVDGRADGTLDPAAVAWELRRLRTAGLIPAAVVATAGTTDLGLIDPIAELADVCAAGSPTHRPGERGSTVWLHVDAAYGGALLVSPRRRHLLAGIDRADSVTVDFHKGFFQPVASSALVVRRGTDLRHVTWHADYLNPAGSGLPHQVDKSLQTTRRFDALKLWLTLRSLGADAVGELVDAVVDLAAETYDRLLERDDIELGPHPRLSTLLFRWVPPAPHLPDDDLVGRIRSDLFAGGEVILAATVHEGRPWLKLTLLNPTLAVQDVLRAVDAVRDSGLRLVVQAPGADAPAATRAGAGVAGA